MAELNQEKIREIYSRYNVLLITDNLEVEKAFRSIFDHVTCYRSPIQAEEDFARDFEAFNAYQIIVTLPTALDKYFGMEYFPFNRAVDRAKGNGRQVIIDNLSDVFKSGDDKYDMSKKAILEMPNIISMAANLNIDPESIPKIPEIETPKIERRRREKPLVLWLGSESLEAARFSMTGHEDAALKYFPREDGKYFVGALCHLGSADIIVFDNPELRDGLSGVVTLLNSVYQNRECMIATISRSKDIATVDYRLASGQGEPITHSLGIHNMSTNRFMKGIIDLGIQARESIVINNDQGLIIGPPIEGEKFKSLKPAAVVALEREKK